MIPVRAEAVKNIRNAAESNFRSFFERKHIMTTSEIFSFIDDTQLKAYCTESDIDRLCEEAEENSTASVCIPPCMVKYAADKYGARVRICTVIGFPLGYSTTAAKVFETEDAVKNGADEIDMVINVTDVKGGHFDRVSSEISLIKKSCAGKLLKVIIETCYLTDEEKIRLCDIITECGADYIKTSTGFGSDGAKLSDIALFKKHIGKNVKIKAAGGIRTRQAAEDFIAAGVSRIGSSSLNAISQGK